MKWMKIHLQWMRWSMMYWQFLGISLVVIITLACYGSTLVWITSLVSNSMTNGQCSKWICTKLGLSPLLCFFLCIPVCLAGGGAQVLLISILLSVVTVGLKKKPGPAVWTKYGQKWANIRTNKGTQLARGTHLTQELRSFLATDIDHLALPSCNGTLAPKHSISIDRGSPVREMDVGRQNLN